MRAVFLTCCLAIALASGCARQPVRQEPRVIVERHPPAASTPAPVVATSAPMPAAPPPPLEPVAAPAAAVDRGQQPPTGQPCRIHFRRDAMGLAAAAPLAIRDHEVPGRTTHKAGTIDQVTDEWVVLKSDERLWWIPRTVILAIELDPPDPPQ